jgi:hypothetical protein
MIDHCQLLLKSSKNENFDVSIVDILGNSVPLSTSNLEGKINGYLSTTLLIDRSKVVSDIYFVTISGSITNQIIPLIIK